MSKAYGPFSVSAGALSPVQTDQYPNANTAVIINESPYTLTVDPGNGSYYIVSAFMQDKLPLGNQYSGVLKISAKADISFQGTPPISVLYVQIYASGEPVAGMYPTALARLMSVGNTVQTGGSVNSINNQNETPPVDVIFDQPTGYTSPSIHLIDTGELHLTPLGNATQADAFAVIPGAGSGVYAVVELDNNTIFTDGQGGLTAQTLTTVSTILAKGAVTIQRSISGESTYLTLDANDGTHKWRARLFTDFSLDFIEANSGNVPLRLLDGGGIKTDNGAIATDGTGVETFSKALSASNQSYIILAPADGAMWNIDELSTQEFALVQGGIKLTVNTTKGTKFQNTGYYLGGVSGFSGTGSGTVNHNLGTTPTGVLPMQSVAGSQTMGYDTLGATTVHITAGAGNAWQALAYKVTA